MRTVNLFKVVLCTWLIFSFFSCAPYSYRIQGEAIVHGVEGGGYLVPNAEVLLVHKKDTLRTTTDELGRFDFGRVKSRSYFIDGCQPQLGVAQIRAVNRVRERSKIRHPRLYFGVKYIEPGRFPPDTLWLQSGGQYRHTYTREEMKAHNRRRMPRWVVVGFVCDGPASGGGVIPKVLTQAKVYVANKRDTVCVATDQWGRYAVWGMRGDECYVWAECEGYHASRPWLVRGDKMYATMTVEQAMQLVRVDDKRLCRRDVHQWAPIALLPLAQK